MNLCASTSHELLHYLLSETELTSTLFSVGLCLGFSKAIIYMCVDFLNTIICFCGIKDLRLQIVNYGAIWFTSIDLLPTGSEEREVLVHGWEYLCCNTSFVSRYESYGITVA